MVERIFAPLVQDRPNNISDFSRFHLGSFFETGTPLGAEEWLNDMENILEVARMPPESQVDVVKIYLTDIVRTMEV